MFEIKQNSVEQGLKQKLLQAEDGWGESMDISQSEIKVGECS